MISKNFRCLLVLLTLVLLLGIDSTKADELRTKYFTIQYKAKDEKVALEIAQKFNSIIWSVNREIGFYNISGIKVLLCSSNSEFTDLMSLAGKLPDQTVAFAAPKFNSITLKNPKDMPAKSDYYKVLQHEYCHILLHQIAPKSNNPLWFEEGFAQYFAEQWNFSNEVEFVMNALQDNTLNLSRYNYHYPKYKNKIEMFYQQSYYNFKKLINDYDFNKFQHFLDDLQLTNNFSASFEKVYGMSVAHFLHKARDSIEPHLILTLFYSGFGLIWTIIPILLLIAHIRKKYKTRKIEREWKEKQEFDIPKSMGPEKSEANSLPDP